MSLFDSTPPATADFGSAKRPLAERMRPERLEDFIGQEHILGPGKPLRRQIERDELTSIILWGPPGVGKTTLAQLIARLTRCEFIPFSAVLSGIKEIKAVMADAERLRRMGRRTILFIDEIHRFNKAQQDAFLPYVERGDIILIGATTENPSFEVISALLSRSRVYALRGAHRAGDRDLLQRALPARAGCDASDATCWNRSPSTPMATRARPTTRWKPRRPHRNGGELSGSRRAGRHAAQSRCSTTRRGEEHFNLISALHKSVRSSDADAALYWLTRMLEAGEDRLYIARRLIRMASEDIGLADPRALEQAIAAMQAVHFLGIPEGDLALAQAAIYLSVAPKSDAAYRAMGAVREDVQNTIAEPVPMNLRNAPTRSHESVGIRRGLPARAQVRRRHGGYGMPAALVRRAAILPPDRPRHGKAHRRTPGRDPAAAPSERAIGLPACRQPTRTASADAHAAGIAQILFLNLQIQISGLSRIERT